jgi:hypothetical protein
MFSGRFYKARHGAARLCLGKRNAAGDPGTRPVDGDEAVKAPRRGHEQVL